MPETFAARFPVSVNSLYWVVCPHLYSALSKFNVWQPNSHVWTHFEPIFSLRVDGWIQTTVSQLADVRGCRAKTPVSSFGRVGTAFSGEVPEARTVLLFSSDSGQIIPRTEIFWLVVESNIKFARHIACCSWSEVKWITRQV